MKRSIYFRALILAATLTGCGVSASRESTDAPADATSAGWQTLFDGQSTEAWRSAKSDDFPSQGWTVEGDVLMLNAGTGDVKGGDLVTREQFGDFILDWEWKMFTKGGNSGVKYFVKTDSTFDTYGPGLEYQILDDAHHPWMLEGKMQPGDYHTLAALYELYPAQNRPETQIDRWNHSRIVAQDDRVEHWLNNVKVLEFQRGSPEFRRRVSESKFAKYPKFGEPDRGHILLQDHGSKMAFRNIRIKPLDAMP